MLFRNSLNVQPIVSYELLEDRLAKLVERSRVPGAMRQPAVLALEPKRQPANPDRPPNGS